MSAALIMSTVRTKKCKALDDDVRQECDRAPVIPTNLIFDLILPFLQDRTTWNSICSANKELHDAGMERTPPWPETKVNLGQSQDYGPSTLKITERFILLNVEFDEDEYNYLQHIVARNECSFPSFCFFAL